MSGAITLKEETFGILKKIVFAWTSDAGGNVNGISTLLPYSGELRRLVTVPSGGGTAPTDLYDITILDEDGVDILLGSGVDRSATLTQQVVATSLGIVSSDKLQLVIANAGNAKQGTAYLYLR